MRKESFGCCAFRLRRTLTRSKLLDEIWGDNVFISARSMHVRRLRRAPSEDRRSDPNRARRRLPVH
jgi:DNA-binding response OmpR family regulator